MSIYLENFEAIGAPFDNLAHHSEPTNFPDGLKTNGLFKSGHVVISPTKAEKEGGGGGRSWGKFQIFSCAYFYQNVLLSPPAEPAKVFFFKTFIFRSVHYH